MCTCGWWVTAAAGSLTAAVWSLSASPPCRSVPTPQLLRASASSSAAVLSASSAYRASGDCSCVETKLQLAFGRATLNADAAVISAVPCICCSARPSRVMGRALQLRLTELLHVLALGEGAARLRAKVESQSSLGRPEKTGRAGRQLRVENSGQRKERAMLSAQLSRSIDRMRDPQR